MNKFAFGSVNLNLRVNQIVCLEHENSSLYGEVIQLIPHRNLCWFRPICLVIFGDVEGNKSFDLNCFDRSEQLKSSQSINSYEAKYQLIDLQSTSDLFWPAILFRPAIDTEAINFIAQLNNIRHHSIDIAPKYKYLNQFVKQFWQANQDKF